MADRCVDLVPGVSHVGGDIGWCVQVTDLPGRCFWLRVAWAESGLEAAQAMAYALDGDGTRIKRVRDVDPLTVTGGVLGVYDADRAIRAKKNFIAWLDGKPQTATDEDDDA